MLAGTEHSDPSEPAATRPHPLDALVPDPSGKPALCGEQKFANILEGMVADSAPRVFAVVQEYGERVDARVAAWGVAFEDHADVLGVGGGIHLGLRDPEDVLRAFRLGTHVTARLVWFNPDAVTPDDY